MAMRVRVPLGVISENVRDENVRDDIGRDDIRRKRPYGQDDVVDGEGEKVKDSHEPQKRSRVKIVHGDFRRRSVASSVLQRKDEQRRRSGATRRSSARRRLSSIGVMVSEKQRRQWRGLSFVQELNRVCDDKTQAYKDIEVQLVC